MSSYLLSPWDINKKLLECGLIWFVLNEKKRHENVLKMCTRQEGAKCNRVCTSRSVKIRLNLRVKAPCTQQLE